MAREQAVHRADIDGLRGVAVLLVVFYHAGSGAFAGGYVGVDVFFTISGYLLTRLLLREQQKGGIALTSFYGRRARRILPASLVVAASVLLGGTVLFAPTDLRELAGSIVAMATFTSNFYFWRRVDYFETAAPEHSLLHTWSLAVEEQFYLLLPLALLAIGRLTPRTRFMALALAATSSALLGLWLTGAHPAAAFYLLPSRCWELLLGGLVALLATAPRSWLAPVFRWAGITLIVAAATQFDAQTPFPGVAALLPCVGTAAILWGGSGEKSEENLLTFLPLVAVGKMSYSLYLWHWPILSFARYWLGEHLDLQVTAACLMLALALAWLTWRWVELPFRERRVLASNRDWWLATVAIVLVLICCATVAGRWGGFFSTPGIVKLEAEIDAALHESKSPCHLGPRGLVREDQLCVFGEGKGGTQVLLWGDSHANSLAPVLKEVARSRRITLVQATYSGCPPLIGTDIAHSTVDHRCREFNDMVLRVVRERGIDVVILSAYWAAYAGNPAASWLSRSVDPYSRFEDLGGGDAVSNRRQFELAATRSGTALAQAGVRVWLVQQIPVQPFYVPYAAIRERLSGEYPGPPGLQLAQHRSETADLRRLLQIGLPNARGLDPASILCKAGHCSWEDGGQPLYIDSHHLARRGSQLLRPLFEPVFDDADHD